MSLGERVVVMDGEVNRNKKTEKGKKTHEHKNEKSWKTRGSTWELPG